MQKRIIVILSLLIFSLMPVNIGVSYAQVDCSSDSAEGFYQRANALEETSEWRDIVDLMNCAIELDATQAEYFNQRGNAYYYLKEYDLALADFEQVLPLDPQATYVLNNIANVYSDLGDTDLAIEYYQQSIDAAPQEAKIEYSNLSLLYGQLGDYEQAIEAAEQAILLDATFALPRLNRAYVYSAIGNLEAANQDYLSWINLNEEDRDTSDLITNSSYTLSLFDGKVYEFTFTANASDVLSVSASATNTAELVDPLIVVLDSAGQPIVSDDDTGLNLDAVVNDFVLETAGTYTILVSSSGGFLFTGASGEMVVTTTLENVTGDAVENDTITTTDSVIPTPEAIDSTIVVSSFETYVLIQGELANVYTTEGDRLNLRSGPDLSFDIVDRLEKWTTVTLLEGPFKADGYAWWKVVTANGVEGWVVERVDNEQTLQLALIQGEEVFISGGDELLNVRANAGRSNELLFQLEPNVTVTLLEGPVEADGFDWWKIRTSDGREGWVVDRIAGIRILVPLKERG
jgi:tetratricopeptide (TPR) repeat protein/uncharacterized protein YgiM (DUF1202 family)